MFKHNTIRRPSKSGKLSKHLMIKALVENKSLVEKFGNAYLKYKSENKKHEAVEHKSKFFKLILENIRFVFALVLLY